MTATFCLCLTGGASRGALIIFRRENKCRGRRSSEGVADCAAGLLDLGGATKNGDAVKSFFVCLALLLCSAVAVAQEPDAQPMQFWSSDAAEDDIAAWLATRGDGASFNPDESWGAGATAASSEYGDYGSSEEPA